MSPVWPPPAPPKWASSRSSPRALSTLGSSNFVENALPAAPLAPKRPTRATIQTTTTRTRWLWHQRPRRPSMGALLGVAGERAVRHVDDRGGRFSSRRYADSETSAVRIGPLWPQSPGCVRVGVAIVVLGAVGSASVAAAM